MTADQYKHIWTLNERSLILRGYAWLWDANLKQVNFCKLFWGYVFAPLALLLRALAPLLRWIGDKLDEADTKKKPKRKPGVNDDTPERIGVFFAKPRVRSTIKIVGIPVLVLLGLAVVGATAYVIYMWPLVVLRVFAVVLGVLAGLTLLVWLGTKYENGGLQGARRFGRFMYAGAVAVKANTCPRIEVQEAGHGRSDG